MYAKKIEKMLLSGEESLGWTMGTVLVHLQDKRRDIDQGTKDLIKEGFWFFANTMMLPVALGYAREGITPHDYGDFVGVCG